MESNKEQKTVKSMPSIDLCNRLMTGFVRNNYDLTDVILRAYQAGHAATTEGMVSKDKIKKLAKALRIKSPTSAGTMYNNGI